MTEYIHSLCHCGWKGRGWLTHKLAEDESVWHVWESHPLAWHQVIGKQMPTTPDPRRLN
jgi:hypothetical protein